MKSRTPTPDHLLEYKPEKREAVNQMFDDIVPIYDKLNNFMSLFLHHRWRKIAVKKIRLTKGENVLDLCCGTGAFFPAILSRTQDPSKLVGVDYNEKMLQKCKEKYPNVQLIQSDACSLPFSEESFDVVTIGWGIRNVHNVQEALQEIYRVLKPKGRLVMIDMAIPQNQWVKKISRWIFFGIIIKVWGLLGKRDAGEYLSKSTDLFLSRKELNLLMKEVGFVETHFRDLLFGNICIHSGAKNVLTESNLTVNKD